MKARIVVYCLILLASSVCVLASTPHSEQSKEIGAALEEMLAAANARDVERYMKVYARTPELVLIFDGMKIKGWQAVRDEQEKWWDHGKADVTYSLRGPVEISPVSDDVFMTLQRLSATTPGPGGTRNTQNLDVSSVWKRTPSGWRIVIAHESFVN